MTDEGHSSIQMSPYSKLCVTADRSKMDLKYFMAKALELISLFLHLLHVIAFPSCLMAVGWVHIPRLTALFSCLMVSYTVLLVCRIVFRLPMALLDFSQLDEMFLLTGAFF